MTEHEAWAREQDAADALASYRARYRIPADAAGEPVVYFCGNSLGLQPVEAQAFVQRELDDWARLAVEAHFSAGSPWFGYHELFREPAARLVGARPGEVVMMNGLTTNLHLMMVSFYRPTAERPCILMENAAFPSDTYAVKSQIAFHGHDPQRDLIELRPREGEATLRTADVEEFLAREGQRIALLLLGGVSYFTGQRFDLERIAAAARSQGCVVGLDLAHAAGNVPLRLHDWDVDFAAWCSYKYLNSGPGGVGGCFVHERHARRPELPRFAGWWGNDPASRFRMHLQPEFEPFPGAEGWQVSNPSILAMAPLRAALADFDGAGMDALREKSKRLTGYLEWWVRHACGERIEILTPGDIEARGCQLSLRVAGGSESLFDELREAGIVCDQRKPDVIRLAPVPLYNSFHDVWRCGRALQRWAGKPLLS